jgi:hypothetical protein
LQIGHWDADRPIADIRYLNLKKKIMITTIQARFQIDGCSRAETSGRNVQDLICGVLLCWFCMPRSKTAL